MVFWMKCTGKNGKEYELREPAMKNGGEGAVYRIEKMPDMVAKVFEQEKRTGARRKKVTYMVENPVPAAVKEQAAWPEDVLYENGRFVGYVMRNIRGGEELNVINGPKYDSMSWKNRVIIANNLCSAVSAMHASGHVIGDMNPKNILVNPRTLHVTLIDVDSYHIVDHKNRNVYRCCVGMGEYIAPELLEKTKNGVEFGDVELPSFTEETDRFALAVHIFTLLMGGYHPFACRRMETATASTVCPRKQENILSGFSPYFDPNSKLGIPKKSPNLDTLPENIRNLFRTAFIDGYQNPKRRPDADSWREALLTLRKMSQGDAAWKIYSGTSERRTVSPKSGTQRSASAGAGTRRTASVGTGTWRTGSDGAGARGTASTGTQTRKSASGSAAGKKRRTAKRRKIGKRLIAAAAIIAAVLCLGQIPAVRNVISNAGTSVAQLYENGKQHLGSVAASAKNGKKEAEEPADEIPAAEPVPDFDENGMLFADSASRYLSKEEIERLQENPDYTYQQLLRYAVNEIYARKGYQFLEDGPYWSFYTQFEWYRQTDKHAVTDEDLNEFEKANIDLLVDIEEENGFREKK